MITIGATFDKMLKQRIFMLFNGNRGVTHTYNLTISTNKSQYDYGESIVVDGLLLRDNAPLPNVAIYIYKGDTLMGTVITDDNGAFTKSISNSTAGEYEIRAFYGSTESNKVNITTRKIVTSLDIDVPLSLVYSDAFNITGTLLDVNSSPLSNKSVKLKVGSTVVDTKTTNSNGVVSFTQTPVTMGTHTFQLVYDGDDTYSNISSTSVTRSINKETTVLTVTSPTNNTAIYSDGSISVTGLLVTDDNEKINGKSVVAKKGNTTLATFTTNSNGQFTGTISGLTVGTNSLRFEFVTDSNYTGSYVDRNVIVNTPTLSLTASKDVIKGGETVTFTATYTGGVKNGRTVTFKVGSTILGTATTNNNGVATFTYTGGYVGVMSVTAECNNVQSTYMIYDCESYDYGISSNYSDIWDNNSNTTIMNFSRGPNSTLMEESSTSNIANGTIVPPNFCIEFRYYQANGENTSFFQVVSSSTVLFTRKIEHIGGTKNNWYDIRLVCENGTYTLYNLTNGVSTTGSYNGIPYKFAFWTSGDITAIYFKNVKIYQLPSVPSIQLTADKTTIVSGQTSTITAKLHNYGGVASKTLNYTVKHGSTTLASGTKTTDSSGTATISYTGTGVGKVDVIVSYGNLLQETYEVYDCLKYDIATTNNHNDIWTTNGVSLTRSSENSNISETTTETDGHIYVEISKQCVIEFDVQLISTNYSLAFYQFGQYPNSSTRLENNLLVKDGNWHHMKLELDNDTLFVSSPETSETKTLTLTNFDSSLGMYFRFRTINGITGINFKNFVVYPI